jgi:hypothetical protein
VLSQLTWLTRILRHCSSHRHVIARRTNPNKWINWMAAWSKALNVFACSNIRIVGWNPTYSVLVLRSGLATGWSAVQEIIPTVLRLRNWSETKRFTDALSSKVGVGGGGGGGRGEDDFVRTFVFSDTFYTPHFVSCKEKNINWLNLKTKVKSLLKYQEILGELAHIRLNCGPYRTC